MKIYFNRLESVIWNRTKNSNKNCTKNRRIRSEEDKNLRIFYRDSFFKFFPVVANLKKCFEDVFTCQGVVILSFI